MGWLRKSPLVRRETEARRNGSAMLAQKFDGVSGKVAFAPTTGERVVSIGLDLWNLLPNGKIVTFGGWEPGSGFTKKFEPIFSTGTVVAPNDGQCPSACQHGDCDHDTLTCRCWPGYAGDDCSTSSPLPITSDMKQDYMIRCGIVPFVYTFSSPGHAKVIRVVVSAPLTLEGDDTITAILISNATGKLVPKDSNTTFSYEDPNLFIDSRPPLPGTTSFTIEIPPVPVDASRYLPAASDPALKPFTLKISTASTNAILRRFISPFHSTTCSYGPTQPCLDS
ncbi:hypothetical protein BJ742DRAFT_44564 [Cladochytrium replicatum]|nr:hypothetical protein BJ742DRAFT_44564 [Cladochytrium replicatum]